MELSLIPNVFDFLKIEVFVDKLSEDVPDLAYKHPGDAGVDLASTVQKTLKPGERGLFPAGIKVALPSHIVMMICSRSGLALKHGVSVANAPGIIDAGYRGEIGVILQNLGQEDYTIHVGDRIAQAVFVPYAPAQFIYTDDLPISGRGTGGFGSTGR
jgi:dUTP pyrophosphatase